MDKFLNFLGLVKKSGKLVEGYSKCDEQRNKNEFYLFIVYKDASDNSKDKFKKHCENKNIIYINDFTKKELGEAVGRPEVNIIGILDLNMANKLFSIYQEDKFME